jgi:hypothetical protein
MTKLDFFLAPGRIGLGFVLDVFQLPLETAEPQLFAILAFFVSWIIWAALIKGAWTITLRLFGFYPPQQ